MYIILYFKKIISYFSSYGGRVHVGDFLDRMILMTGLVIRARVRNQGKDVTNPRQDRPDCADWISGTIPSQRHVTASTWRNQWPTDIH